MASLHRVDLSKCLLSKSTVWCEESGMCNVNTTYTHRIINAQRMWLSPCEMSFTSVIASNKLFKAWLLLFFFINTQHSVSDLPNHSLHKNSISFNNFRAPQPKGKMSLCQVALATTGDAKWVIPYHIWCFSPTDIGPKDVACSKEFLHESWNNSH